MRVALLRRVTVADDVRESVPSLLARPLEDLAADLIALGHQVTVVEARSVASRRTRQQGLSLEALDRIAQRRADSSSPWGLTVLRCAGRRDLLQALDPATTDVTLAVGRGAAELLDRLSSELRVRWAWSPGPCDLRSEPGRIGPWLPRQADRFVVGSLSEVDLLARAGVSRDRCDVVPWQLSSPTRVLRPLGEVPEYATSALTSAGAGSAGVADVIRAVAVLPEWRLSVAVDDATSADGFTIDRWLRLATGLRTADRIRFVRIRSGEGLRVLVRSADVVVSLPHGRPESSVLATAMWAGTPVVASDVDGVRELVESGTTGLLLPAGQPRRLARALRVVGRDTPARSGWAWAARRHATELLGREGTAAGLALSLEAASAAGASASAWALIDERLDEVAVG